MQAFVFGSQLFPPHAVSFAAVHATQRLGCPMPLERHRCFPETCVQSLSSAHGAQVFEVGSQREMASLVQSAFWRHATHCFFSLLQNGLAGVLAQSAFSRHSTQTLLGISQVGLVPLTTAAGAPAKPEAPAVPGAPAVPFDVVLPAQSAFTRHSTQALASILQMRLDASLQSPLTTHSMQVESLASQTFLAAIVQLLFAAQPTHWCFLRSQNGAAPPQ